MNLNLLQMTLFMSIPLIQLLSVLAYVVLRFFLFGAIPAWILTSRLRRSWPEVQMHRLGSRVPPQSQLNQELIYSLGTVTVQYLTFVVLKLMEAHGVSKIYHEVSHYGWAYIGVQIVLLVVLLDAYGYWTHRLLHVPFLLKNFHKVHHRSVDLSSMSAISFHPVDAIIQNLFGPLLVLLIPVHQTTLGAFAFAIALINFYGHSGFEFFPKAWLNGRIGRHFAASSFHWLHHRGANTNFGLYLRFWDKALGTEHPNYQGMIQ